MIRIGSIIVGAALAAMLAPATVSAQQKTQIFVGTDYPFATAYVADGLGIFKRNGLDVVVNTFNTGTDAVQAMRSARAGFVIAGDMPSAKTWSVGDVVGVAPVTWDDSSLAVLAIESIKRAADLKGKKVATRIGSSGEIFFTNFLRQNGIARNQVDMLNLSPGDMPVAMANGDIVAYLWNQPTTAVGMRAVKGAHFLTDGTKGFGMNRILLSAARPTAEGSPDEVTAVIKSLLEAQAVIKNEPDKAYPIIAKIMSTSVEKVKEQIAAFNYDMTVDKAFVEDMTTKIEIATALGIASGPIDWDKQWMTKFAKAVDPRLVKFQP